MAKNRRKMKAGFDENMLYTHVYDIFEHYIFSTMEMCKISIILTKVKMLRSECLFFFEEHKIVHKIFKCISQLFRTGR